MTITVKTASGPLSISAETGESLLQALRRRPNLAPPAPCAGRGRCGRCRVIMESPSPGEAAPAIHDDEKALLSDEDRAAGVRLACRVAAADGMTVRLEEAGAARIETRAEGQPVDLDPVLTKLAVVLPAGHLDDQRSAAARMEDALGLPRGCFPSALAQSLPAIPDGRTPHTVVLDDGVPAALDVGSDTSDHLWTAAVDIGTTTVAMYLVDLIAGTAVDSRAQMNRQAPYGADVISRLEYARGSADGAREIQAAIVGQLRDMLEELCGVHGIEPQDLHRIAVAGNTAMIHLMAGWDPTGLGEAPFLPTILEVPPFPAREIGLEGFPRLRIWPLPSLSAYVGADITGGLVAAGMRDRPGTDLLLDIGTNGEMALGGSEGLICCSTAAGPAFEGAHLSAGVGSIPGAVDHLDVDGKGHWRFSTIEGAPAAGFCGSGVVDLVAFLLKAGLMDETGRLAESLDGDADRFGNLEIHRDENGPVLSWPVDGDGMRRIRFTQKDLREVQLAKAAISAGIQTLMGLAGLEPDDVGTLWLAGGFGSYIRPESAAAIGLIPRSLADKTRSLGNAAARGALLSLLSRTKHREAVAVAREARTVELSGRPDFQDAYIDGMMFPV